MQKRLLNILCCPVCGADLTAVTVDAGPNDSIRNGRLECPCGETFPIIGSVPRLLIGDLRAQALGSVQNQPATGGSCQASVNRSSKDVAARTVLHTQASFGYEWTEFNRYAVDNFSLFIKPLGEGFFAGKLGLDVGCGAGRHAQQAATLGAQIIGMDLSQAVDVAVRRDPEERTTQFVQADIRRAPFRQASFDFIYSLGVLHHLPDPEEGFRGLMPLLKPGAVIFIWVYQRTTRKELLEHARRVTTRLPLWLAKGVAWFATVLDYGVFVNAYRLFRRLAVVEQYAPLRIKEYAGYDFYASYTDWFDRLAAPVSHSYSEEEMLGWFRRAGLAEIETTLVGDSWVWAKGRKAGSCTS
ncbi:MAG: methyltransferase domain-containing protein [Nitrospirae bacterium]|nr:MAG: methyltransferase domain-containing protein [Nitrospirota bacterium]